MEENGMWNIETLWNALEEQQGKVFYTAKKLPFQYAVRGGEMFVDRRSRSITKSTFAIALDKLQQHPGQIRGPKALNVFGAPYVWALLTAFGVPDSFCQSDRDDENQI